MLLRFFFPEFSFCKVNLEKISVWLIAGVISNIYSNKIEIVNEHTYVRNNVPASPWLVVLCCINSVHPHHYTLVFYFNFNILWKWCGISLYAVIVEYFITNRNINHVPIRLLSCSLLFYPYLLKIYFINLIETNYIHTLAYIINFKWVNKNLLYQRNQKRWVYLNIIP